MIRYVNNLKIRKYNNTPINTMIKERHHSYLYASFIRQFDWDVSTMPDGYLVQRIDRRTIGKDEFSSQYIRTKDDFFNHSYYEAWKVENEKIVYYGLETKKSAPDDTWSLDFMGKDLILERLLLNNILANYKDRYNTAGSVTMTGIVAFVRGGAVEAALIDNKNIFDYTKIKFAGELIKSARVCRQKKYDIMEKTFQG